MANEISTQVLFESSTRYYVKICIVGDGSGEETDTKIVDVSALTPAATSLTLIRVQAAFIGFTARLLWDATTNVGLVTMPEYWIDFNFNHSFGGIENNGGAGVTGDVLMTTAGLGATDSGFMVLEFKKNL